MLLGGARRKPHVEEAVVFAVKGAAAHVFVGQYHIRGVVHLADRSGVPILPPESLVPPLFCSSHLLQFTSCAREEVGSRHT